MRDTQGLNEYAAIKAVSNRRPYPLPPHNEREHEDEEDFRVRRQEEALSAIAESLSLAQKLRLLGMEATAESMKAVCNAIRLKAKIQPERYPL